MQELRTFVKGDGRAYSVRSNRDRFFYPHEWMKFYDSLKRKSQRLTFDVLLNTGARINEARHIKVGDIDFERNTIMLRVTKVKAKKGEKNPRPRTIAISTQLGKRLKKHIEEKKLNNEDYIGVLSTPASNICLKKALSQVTIQIVKRKALAKGVAEILVSEGKAKIIESKEDSDLVIAKVFETREVSVNKAERLVTEGKAKIVKPAIVKDHYMFSVHNIRKTHGNWLKALGIDGAEICLRLGHDYNTYLKSYGSPDIFNFKDLEQMRLILGDLYTNRVVRR